MRKQREHGFNVIQLDKLGTNAGKEWLIEAMVENVRVKFKVGTDCRVNILSLLPLRSASTGQHMLPSAGVLRSCNGIDSDPLRMTKLALVLEEKTIPVKFFVKKGRCTLMELQTCEALGLVNLVHEVAGSTHAQSQVRQDFPAMFQGLKKVRSPYNVSFKEDVMPLTQATRRMSHALVKPLKQELHCMENAGICTRMTTF